jgi:surface protein
MFYKSKYTGRNGIFNIKNNGVVKGIKMLGTFEDSKDFDCDLSKWDVSNVSTMANMFSGTKFNHDISNWKIDDDCVVRDMFSKTPIRKNNNLPQWYLDKSEW